MTANMVLGGDPNKLDVAGYTKGDIIAADPAGILEPVAVGADTTVLTANSVANEGVDWQAGGGGGGTPSNTVVTETTFGQAATAGALTDYSRGDHTHGTPAAPSVPTPSGTVVTETTFGQAATAGAATAYSAGDHTHGTPAAPTAASVGADPAGSAAAAQAASQPLDADLTTIAGLTATSTNVIQSVAGAWASRSPAQLVATLGLVVGDVSGAAPAASPTFTGTATFSGRQVTTPDVLADTATIAVDASLGNQFTITLGGNRTLGNPTNSTDGQMILFAIRQDAGGNRTLALDTNYRFGTDITGILLSTTGAKTDYLGVRYNGTDSKWDVIAFVKGY